MGKNNGLVNLIKNGDLNKVKELTHVKILRNQELVKICIKTAFDENKADIFRYLRSNICQEDKEKYYYYLGCVLVDHLKNGFNNIDMINILLEEDWDIILTSECAQIILNYAVANKNYNLLKYHKNNKCLISYSSSIWKEDIDIEFVKFLLSNNIQLYCGSLSYNSWCINILFTTKDWKYLTELVNVGVTFSNYKVSTDIEHSNEKTLLLKHIMQQNINSENYPFFSKGFVHELATRNEHELLYYIFKSNRLDKDTINAKSFLNNYNNLLFNKIFIVNYKKRCRICDWFVKKLMREFLNVVCL